MKKILFVLPSLTQANGVSAFLINYLKNMDLAKFDIDILASDLRPSESYIKFFEENNIKVYLLPFFRTNGLKKYIKSLKEFFKENHDYDIIYSNVINQSIFIFHEAKKYGIKKLVLHAHATVSSDNKIKKIINNICIKFVAGQATKRIACSELAGKAMYKNKSFEVVNNAIDYNKYAFSEKDRTEVREKLKISDNELIIGFVGRFAPQKNIFFFDELAKLLSNKFRIIMIGTGEQKENFVEKLSEDNILEKFIFIEECSDVYKYYSAMDIFMLPSLYEGLPVVSVEAQATGVKCLLSDRITQECKILEQTKFLPINEINTWVEQCEKYKNINRIEVKLNEKFDIKVQEMKFHTLLEIL